MAFYVCRVKEYKFISVMVDVWVSKGFTNKFFLLGLEI
jgi:hypothetical protein